MAPGKKRAPSSSNKAPPSKRAPKTEQPECHGQEVQQEQTEPDEQPIKQEEPDPHEYMAPVEHDLQSPEQGRSKKACSGAAAYRCNFKDEWTKKWPFITRGSLNTHYWCAVCRVENACCHMGVADVARHIKGKGHQGKQQALQAASSGKSSPASPDPVSMIAMTSMNDFLQRQQALQEAVARAALLVPTSPVEGMGDQEAQTRRAEVKMTAALVQHNVPLSLADHLGLLMKECFRDSKTAQGYKCARTKMASILNEALAPHFKKELVLLMRKGPYTLITDGSNDKGKEKMNPLTVRIFDANVNKVTHRFLGMCTASDPGCEITDGLFHKINATLQENGIPWQNCVGVSIDNGPADTDAQDCIASRILGENPTIYIHGCPCHVVHNIAEQAGQGFMVVSGFDVEDLVVDVGYWFQRNANSNGYLIEFGELHGSEYMEILQHISVRWLSLERCLTRILMLYHPLASYFKSANLKQPRFRRLQETFSNPMTEVYLLFFQATIPAFSSLNLLLQREQSSIFLLYDEMVNFIRKLCARFMVPAALQSHQEPHNIAFKEKANHLLGAKMNVGFSTRTKLNRLLTDGVITPQHVESFHEAALAFLIKAVDYALKILPLENPLLKHAKFVDVRQRLECCVDDALYFVERFSHLLPYHGPHEHDQLATEFLEYQTTPLPPLQDPEGGDMGSFWAEMGNQKHKVTGVNCYQRLASIAKLVLVLPHSNADAERVLSAVGLNKTKTRNSLALDGTLSSILTVKMAGLEPCCKWEPPPTLIKASKKATSHYNKTHKSTNLDTQFSTSM